MQISSIFQNFFTKKNLLRFLVEVLIIIALIVGVQYWRTKDMLATNGTITVEPMDAVKLDGGQITLFQDQKSTLLYFFAPWCQVCGWSVGSLDNLADTDLNIIAIAMDYESLEAVEKFVEDHEMKVDVVLGNTAIGQQFGIKGYPSYYMLNKERQVVAKHFGLSTSIHIKLQNWLANS